jgi:hypothetical protein
MKVISGQWRRLLAGALATSVLLLGVGVFVRGEDKPVKKDEKPAPKSDDKTPKKEEKSAPKKDAEDDDLPGFPNIDEMLKKMPGLDADQLKKMRMRMEEMRKQLQKQMREARKRQGIGGIGGLPAFPRMPILPGGFPGLPGMGRPEGAPLSMLRLGAHLIKPSKTLEDQLDLPKDQGLVLEEVGPNSAAAKAGLKRYDILLELNGKPVSSKIEEFAKQLADVKPTTPVDAVVMRKGKKETIKGLTLPEAKVPAPPAIGLPGRPGVFQPGGLKPPAFGGLPGSTTVNRVNDEFTATHKDNGVRITVKGKTAEGKPVVSEVAIESDGKTKTYDSLDKVPAEYKEKAQKLAAMGAMKTPRKRPRVDD